MDKNYLIIKKRGKLDTIRKNIVGLHASGLIEMDTEFTENTGKKGAL
ncbi:MAG: hypothetical protein V8S55_11115 [Mediterraneibacter faecis]